MTVFLELAKWLQSGMVLRLRVCVYSHAAIPLPGAKSPASLEVAVGLAARSRSAVTGDTECLWCSLSAVRERSEGSSNLQKGRRAVRSEPVERPS